MRLTKDKARRIAAANLSSCTAVQDVSTGLLRKIPRDGGRERMPD
jgi:hypothetical protein